MMLFPPKECPRYPKCSVNHCPLDPQKHKRIGIPGDKERVCTMEKRVRQRVASKYAAILPLAGLTAREAAGIRSWLKYPEFQKWKMQEEGRELLRRINARRRGKA